MEPENPQFDKYPYIDQTSPKKGVHIYPTSGKTYQHVKRDRIFSTDATEFIPHTDEVHVEGETAIKRGKNAKKFIGDINKATRLRRETGKKENKK